MTAILGGVWKDQAASAFGLFKFVQSLASAISFFYSAFIEFHWQLLIVVCFGFVGTIACVKLEMDTNRWVVGTCTGGNRMGHIKQLME